MLLLLLPSLLMSACGTGQTNWDDCADPDCYTQLAQQRWREDRAGLIEDLAALDPVAQEAVVMALVDAQPDQLQELCAQLPAGPAAKRCNKLIQRPHLLGGRGNTAPRKAGVPGLVDHTGIENVPSPWADVPAGEVDCDLRQDDCLTQSMLAAARTGDPEAVARVCNGVPDDTFRRECFFRAAETMAVVQAEAQIEPMPTAAALCLAAESYAELCVRELGRAIARVAPAADQPDPQAWERTAGAVAALEAGLAEHDAAVAQRVADRAWSAVLWGSYARAQRVTGIPQASLPPAALPHLRATVTWMLMEREGDEARDLEAWLERARQALADTEPGPPPTDDGVRPTRFTGSSIDPATDPEPWVHYLGDNYRQVHDDPQHDLMACILEAAARQSRPALLEQATGEGWPEPIQQLATRLVSTEMHGVRKAGHKPGSKPPPPPPGGKRPGPPGGPQAPAAGGLSAPAAGGPPAPAPGADQR
jgi:hypothetical protein